MMLEEKCQQFYDVIKGEILSALQNLDVTTITLRNDGSLWAQTPGWGEYRLGYLLFDYADKVINAARVFPKKTKLIDDDYEMDFTIPAFEELPEMAFMMNTSSDSDLLFTLKRKIKPMKKTQKISG